MTAASKRLALFEALPVQSDFVITTFRSGREQVTSTLPSEVGNRTIRKSFVSTMFLGATPKSEDVFLISFKHASKLIARDTDCGAANAATDDMPRTETLIIIVFIISSPFVLLKKCTASFPFMKKSLTLDTTLLCGWINVNSFCLQATLEAYIPFCKCAAFLNARAHRDAASQWITIPKPGGAKPLSLPPNAETQK